MNAIAATSMSPPQNVLAKWAAQAPSAAKFGKAAESAGGAADGETVLRDKLGEFVGNVFYATLLKQMQESSLKGKYFHGGRGEEVFQGQLSLELARRLGRAPNDPVVNQMYEAMSRRQESGASEADESAAG